jgi:oxalate decarboxylase/phosphoglucose isomerase-like protein (cupin superfamily)
VARGDAVLVPSGIDHGLYNTGTEPLRLVLLWGEPQATG